MRSNEKQTKEKIRRKDIRRDAEFCSILTQELDMEQAPDSYGKAMKRIYAELPRDMPVRHYPFRSALRSMAVVAALLFVFGLSLVGANRAYPQLTESLPGLGMVFKHINGTVEDGTPNLPPVVQVVPVNSGPHKIPVFTPVTLEGGGFTVENAWSDGAKLYLCVQIEELWMLSPENMKATIGGVPADNVESLLQTVDENERYSAVWVFPIPEEALVGESVRVRIDLSYDGGRMLEGSFSVEIDKDFAVEVKEVDSDNRYLLENVRYTPGQLTATVSVPFMGYYGYSLLPRDGTFGGPDPSTPYGMYAVLTEEDGTVLSEQSLAGYTLADFNSEEGENLYPNLAFSALLPPADREKLVLTFYQFDPQELKDLAEKAIMPQEAIVNPVTAEFTIDLAERTAEPSENYRKDGQIKLDSARPLMGNNHPAFENGLYVRGVGRGSDVDGVDTELVELLLDAKDLENLPSWALECYLDGELAQIVTACNVDGDAFNATLPDDPEQPVYDSGSGCFWLQGLEEPYEDGAYVHVCFLVRYSDWVYDGSGKTPAFNQMRLVDAETGEVLIEDVQAAYQKNLIAVLTAQPYK